MSTSWGGLSSDHPNRVPLHDPDRSSSRVERRVESRDDPGAWSEDLEESVYGEMDWTIPGMGKRPESCGRWYPDSFCDSGHVNLGMSRCQNRDCPDCYGSYSRKRAVKVARRLGAARYAAEDDADKRAIHAVVSPPEGTVRTIRDFYEMLTDAYQLAKEKGIRGGVAIPHAYRVLESTKAEYRLLEDPDGGVWWWIRENDRHWRDQVYWSPHVHIQGLARYDETGENAPEEDGGWVFKRIKTLDRFELYKEPGYDHMIGTTRYLLSHATYEIGESKQVIRWFGTLAPAMFSPEEEVSEGVLRVIERMAEEVAGSMSDQPEDGHGTAEEGVCDQEGCDSETHPIWEAGEALQHKNFCKEIGEELERELRVAFRWAIGEVVPPPGLKHPRTEEQAREALDALL